jgi:hypothetical protein
MDQESAATDRSSSDAISPGGPPAGPPPPPPAATGPPQTPVPSIRVGNISGSSGGHRIPAMRLAGEEEKVDGRTLARRCGAVGGGGCDARWLGSCDRASVWGLGRMVVRGEVGDDPLRRGPSFGGAVMAVTCGLDRDVQVGLSRVACGS